MKNKKYIEFLNTFTFKQWVWFYFGLCLIIISVISLLYGATKRNLYTVPAPGGVYSEGIVGTIRFINPVLAVNDTEKDMANLVFRGLFKKDADGNINTLLAKSFTVSEDKQPGLV
jgi:peptide/nickel transport system substrate-binding protein